MGRVSRQQSLIALICALVLVAAACGNGNGEATQEEEEPIVIGLALAETGFVAFYDQPNKQALLMAAEEYNQKGGILGRPLEVIEATDHRSDPTRSADAVVELIDRGVDIGVTSCDFDVGGPAALQFQNAGIVSLSVCAAGLLFGPLGGLDFGFSMGDSTAGSGAVAAEFAFNEQGWRTAYVLLDTLLSYSQEMCDAFVERFEELGGTIVGEDTFFQEDESIRGQISRIQGLDEPPDVIRLCTVIPGMTTFVNEIRASLDTPIIAGLEADGDYWHEGVPNMRDFFYLAKGSLFGDDSNEEFNEFVDRYEEFVGQRPDDSAASGGYTIIQALDIAAERAGTIDGEALVAELEAFDNVELLTGPTSFSDAYHVATCRPMAIMAAVGQGDIQFVTRLAPTVVPLPESVGGGTLEC